MLDEFALPSFVKTSGSKGFHIVVPLAAGADFEQVTADRGDRIFVDSGRNGPGATCAAVYAVRPKEGAPVSAPCTWAEVESGAVGPQTFTIATVPQRLAELGDLWAPMPQQGVSLKSALMTVEAGLTDDDWKESMAATTRRPTWRKKPAG